MTKTAKIIFAGAVAAAMAFPVWASSASRTILTVDGVPVTQAQVQARAYKNYGDAALNDLVNKILVNRAMKEYRVAPSDAAIDSRIKNIRGQFKDEKTFEKSLTANGTSLAALRLQIRSQIMREDLVKKALGISVSDEDVRNYFDAHKQDLGVPEAAHVRDVLVASKKEADDMLVALKSGADFSKVASEVSLDKATKDHGGDMGFISKGMLQPDIQKAVFSAKPGSVVGPLALPNGYFILKVEEFRAAKPAAFADVSKKLKAAILADKIAKAWPQFLQQLRQKAKITPNVHSVKAAASQKPR
ncbi:MAG: peptidylprolyl isomerase [Elusimicrobiota bacterium]